MKKYELLFVVKVQQEGEDELDAECRARINMDLFRANTMLRKLGVQDIPAYILNDAKVLMVKEVE